MFRTQDSGGKPRILFVDAYDSFSNNIVALLEISLEVHVTVVKIDHDISDLATFLSPYSAVVVGPGPGNPCKPEDIGFIDKIWSLKETDLIPILGICLGFQCLAVAFGATIERLKTPKHGITSVILHNGTSIFSGVGGIQAVQYHSLHANIGHAIQIQRAVSYPAQLWSSTRSCPALEPLAWDLDDLQNGAVLMAVRHTKKPFWGIQYHPESICTDQENIMVVENWWKESQRWNSENRSEANQESFHRLDEYDVHLKTSIDNMAVGESQAAINLPLEQDPILSALKSRMNVGSVDISTANSISLSVPELCETLRLDGFDTLLLDSELAEGGIGRCSIIGLIIPNKTIQIEYSAGSQSVRYGIVGKGSSDSINLERHGNSIWQYLSFIMKELKTKSEWGASDFSPFWGGFIGYVSYEMGLSNIGALRRNSTADPGFNPKSNTRPDMNFAFIERSLVIDHQRNKVYIQTLLEGDGNWCNKMEIKLARKPFEDTRARRNSRERREAEYQRLFPSGPLFSKEPSSNDMEANTRDAVNIYLKASKVDMPAEDEYRKKVKLCQESIAAGDSYELCLTAQTTLRIPKTTYPSNISWHMYKILREKNPAPFGAYIRLGSVTILSCSPERFLSWDRESACQLRPIKGTVKKTPGMTKELAEEILSSQKERAENLMIVDLIRHDLHGVVGPGNVRVDQLMVVEEYKTVYQLVSVIGGNLHPTAETSSSGTLQRSQTANSESDTPSLVDNKRVTGIDVLAASLPPGSMTGAPKLRSCQILDRLEDHVPRGIYSGVLGYLSVCGSGDFSVIIRSAVKYDDEGHPSSKDTTYSASPAQAEDHQKPSGKRAKIRKEEVVNDDVWHIGAGGAVTGLSTDLGEWEEMRTKLDSTLRAFEPKRVLTTRQRREEEELERSKAMAYWMSQQIS